MQQTSSPAEPSVQEIRALVNAVVAPQATVGSLRLLAHHRLQQIYEATLSDTTTLLVVLPPPSTLRLLRSEQNMIRTEAVVVRWLREEALASLSRPSETTSAAVQPLRTSEALLEALGGGRSSLGTAESTLAKSGLLRNGTPQISLPFPITVPDDATARAFSTPTTVSVFRPPAGTPVSALSPPLTPDERTSVDYQAGSLVRQLARLTAHSNEFGPALVVLAAQSGSGAPSTATNPAPSMHTWSVAFHSILESILRDGEDVAVSVPYSLIRKQFRRLRHVLDTVDTPSLVVVDAVDDTNLLVKRHPVAKEKNEQGDAEQTRRSSSSLQPTQHAFRSTTLASTTSDVTTSSVTEPFAAGIVVTGLRDWSHCVFGDPLFASVFSEQPSTSFLRGFDGAEDSVVNVAAEDREARASHEDGHEDGDDRATTTRLLLYQCYHAVVRIVKGFYRPGRDQTTHELAARKRLTEALAKLAATDTSQETMAPQTATKYRHRRPSGDMSPAKRTKSDDSGDEIPKKEAT
ncbi:hypothetical protein SPI_08745 [Niveomyces insectorum RCEF 264]|uniref:Uncharacterized protein n=1 Tax=Niveomyces insectorum RCEF 264 TaxID=1081102 RepID=A0A167MLF3_9HYPO|nr:hypothetical protein SPI_08745 [Niveomyces insectorum RCEF 264]